MLNIDTIEQSLLIRLNAGLRFDDMPEEEIVRALNEVDALIEEVRRLQEIENHLSPVMRVNDEGAAEIAYYADGRAPEHRAKFEGAMKASLEKHAAVFQKLAEKEQQEKREPSHHQIVVFHSHLEQFNGRRDAAPKFPGREITLFGYDSVGAWFCANVHKHRFVYLFSEGERTHHYRHERTDTQTYIF